MKLNLKKLVIYLKDLDRRPTSGFKTELESDNVVHRKTFKRKHVLVDFNEKPSCVCFLEEGFATAYRKDGEDLIVSWFKTSRSGIIPESFFTRQSSKERIVLSPGSTIVYTSFEGMQYLLEKYPETQELIRLIQDKHLRENEEEKMLLRKLSGKEKYQYMLDHRPEVIRRASLKDIASYLGIRLRQFYNIRRKLKKR